LKTLCLPAPLYWPGSTFFESCFDQSKSVYHPGVAALDKYLSPIPITLANTLRQHLVNASASHHIAAKKEAQRLGHDNSKTRVFFKGRSRAAALRSENSFTLIRVARHNYPHFPPSI
jgi:hypothetical protein